MSRRVPFRGVWQPEPPGARQVLCSDSHVAALSHCRQHERGRVADLGGFFTLQTTSLQGASCTLQAGTFSRAFPRVSCRGALGVNWVPWVNWVRFEVWRSPLSFPFWLVPAI